MDTSDFQKLIGKPVYVIWDFTSKFFKLRGNGVYFVLNACDDYVHLQKDCSSSEFWALCDQIEEAKEHIKIEEPEFNSPTLEITQVVDVVYVDSGKIEPRAFGLELENPIIDDAVIIQPEEANIKRARSETRKSRAHQSKPRIKHKDGIFLCHFGVKYIPGINAIGKGETPRDAYYAWKSANDKLMETKAAKRAEKAASGGVNGTT